jgi:altronate dehydratase small subunit
MEKHAKLIDEKDNVATSVADCVAGDELTVRFKGRDMLLKCNHDIPFGHKIAIRDLKKGDPVIKYGQPIGSASRDIKQGDWVHTQNVRDDYVVLDKIGNPMPGRKN